MVTAIEGLIGEPAAHDDDRPTSSIAAFIDFDGTLAAGFTGALLPWDRLRGGEMGIRELLATVWVGLNYTLGRLDFEDFIRRGALTLRGRHLDDLPEIGQRLYTTHIQARIYPEMKNIVSDHLARGHVIVITSAAFHVQVEAAARALGITEILCNQCEVDDAGVLTGEVVKPILRGRSKAEAIISYATTHDIDLAESYFYADGDEDIPAMTLVGNPRPTNPRKGLERLANEQGWLVSRFTSRCGNVPTARARTGLATLASMPLAVVATCAAALRLTNYQPYEQFTAYWPRLMLNLVGVALNVTGAQHVDPTQPALYLVNHRSMADAVIVGALLRRPWAATPQGLHTDAVTTTVRRLFGVHEDDDRHLGQQSLVAAAEGGMQATPEIGKFDESPFRFARQAGLRIVPIVIRNIEVIAVPNSLVLHPGTLDIAVLKPVSVTEWAESDVAARVANVRQAYIEMLENWPGLA